MKRVVIAGGGTGGHFYPGYVLGKTLQEKGWEVLYLIRQGDPAAAKLAQEDRAFLEIDIGGMPRGASLKWGSFGVRLFRGSKLTYRALRAFKPRCVIGTGGHVSFPAVFSAWRLGIPSMVIELNSQLGLANRACLPFTRVVAMGLPFAHRPKWPAKVRYELCGIPVRPEFWKLPDAAESRRALGLDPEKRTLLIFGGSQGALGINQRVPAAVLKLMRSRYGQLQCLHLSGPKNEAAVRESYGSEASAKVMPYLQEMYRAYAAANLVICRSGASTLAELIAARKPAVLVPLPTSAGGHQSTNARVLADIGAAICVKETDIAAESLASMLDDLIFSSSGSRSRLQEMSESYGRLRLPAPEETVSLLAAQAEALANTKKES